MSKPFKVALWLLAMIFTWYVVWAVASAYFESKRQPAVKVEQIYAGEQLPELTAVPEQKPAHYSCANPAMRVFLVIAGTGEFMVFDGRGAWVDNGKFLQRDTSIPLFEGFVRNSLISFAQIENAWHLFIVSPDPKEPVQDLICI